jgi:hypothetical protein
MHIVLKRILCSLPYWLTGLPDEHLSSQKIPEKLFRENPRKTFLRKSQKNPRNPSADRWPVATLPATAPQSMCLTLLCKFAPAGELGFSQDDTNSL